MESIKKLKPFTSRLSRMMDREKLKRRGIAPGPIEEEAEKAKSLLPRPSVEAGEFPDVGEESNSVEGEVPSWIRDLVSRSDVKPVSLDRMREILSKCKKPLSREIIEERHGDEVE